MPNRSVCEKCLKETHGFGPSPEPDLREELCWFCQLSTEQRSFMVYAIDNPPEGCYKVFEHAVAAAAGKFSKKS